MSLDRANYPIRYKLRPRAVVLEALEPKISSRRVLSAEIPAAALEADMKEFERELKTISSLLTDFEIDWYRPLLSDRLRRVAALHEIGITHGDVRDDHFRIPGDFYDMLSLPLLGFSFPSLASIFPFLQNVALSQSQSLCLYLTWHITRA